MERSWNAVSSTIVGKCGEGLGRAEPTATQLAAGRVVPGGGKRLPSVLQNKLGSGAAYLGLRLSTLLKWKRSPAFPVCGNWMWWLKVKRGSRGKGPGGVGSCKGFVAGSTHQRGGARGRDWSRMSSRTEASDCRNRNRNSSSRDNEVGGGRGRGGRGGGGSGAMKELQTRRGTRNT